MKLACLFSGGKDSTYAIHLVKKQGHEVSCLLSVFPKSDESHLLHHPNLKWTKLQSESMKIPQLIIESSSDETSDELIVLEKLLKNHIQITLAGIKWHRFAKKHQNNPNLIYLGNGVYGKDYVTTLQNAKMAWGAISKWIPELHTTRTFEIPACGTVLVTERNTETLQFFNEDEVLFFSNEAEMVDKISVLLLDDEALQQISQKGHLRATTSGYDYQSQLLHICSNIGLLNNA